MFLKYLEAISAKQAEPGDIVCFPSQGNFIYCLTGSATLENNDDTRVLVILDDKKLAIFGGDCLLYVRAMDSACILRIKGAKLVPEFSENSYFGVKSSSHLLMLGDGCSFFRVNFNMLNYDFDLATGKDDNKQKYGLADFAKWRLEAEGTDGKPVVLYNCP